MSALILRTDRLVLTPLAVADAAELHALFNDPGVRRYLWDDREVSAEQTTAVIGDSVAAFEAEGWGLWAARRAERDPIVGFCGYRPFHVPPVVELLFGFHPSCWGQGLAAESARAAIDYAFDVLGFPRVDASTDPPNAASVRLLERLGFRYARRSRSDGLETRHFVLEAPKDAA